MALTMPYPQIGTVVRPIGQGCTSCSNRTICPALYWYKRYTFAEPEPPNGRACLSWTNEPSPLPTDPATADDLALNDRMWHEGIMSEANRNGVSPNTSGSRQSEGN